MIRISVFIVFACVLTWSTSLTACDVCGSGGGNIGIGLLTDYRSNLVRFSYANTRFNSVPEHGNLVSDKFVQYSLAFRYSLGKTKRFRLALQCPFAVNTRNVEGKSLIEKGLSDIKLTTSYVVLNNLPIGSKSNIYLETGAGFNLPTGKYDEQLHDKDLPENFNVGKGNLGYIFQMNSILSIQKFGFVFSNNFQLNTATKSGYRFGNQFNSQLTAFKEVAIKNVKWIPNVGLGFDNTTSDNYSNKKEVPGTGGNGFFLSTSFNFKTEQWLAGFTYALPLVEQYAQGEVHAKGRIIGQVSLLF